MIELYWTGPLRRLFTVGSAAALLLGTSLAVHAENVQISASADTSLYQEDGDAADALGPGLFSGRNSGGLSRRALLRFDVAAAIPAGATVTAVQLRLSLTRTTSEGVDLSLYKMLAAWGEGTSNAGVPGGSGVAATPGDATWTARVYPAVLWTTPGGDAAVVASATTQVGDVLGDYVWPSNGALVSDVQGWLDQPTSNSGWMLRSDESAPPPTAKRFASREYPIAALQPLLSVDFDVSSAVPVMAPTLGWPALLSMVGGLLMCAGLARKRTP